MLVQAAYILIILTVCIIHTHLAHAGFSKWTRAQATLGIFGKACACNPSSCGWCCRSSFCQTACQPCKILCLFRHFASAVLGEIVGIAWLGITGEIRLVFVLSGSLFYFLFLSLYVSSFFHSHVDMPCHDF